MTTIIRPLTPASLIAGNEEPIDLTVGDCTGVSPDLAWRLLPASDLTVFCLSVLSAPDSVRIWDDLRAAGFDGICADVTFAEIVPHPEMIVCVLVISQAGLDWILASPKYGEGSVLYVE